MVLIRYDFLAEEQNNNIGDHTLLKVCRGSSSPVKQIKVISCRNTASCFR